MKDIDELPESVMTESEKRYINRIYEENEASVFPDKTHRKLLEMICSLSKMINDINRVIGS